MARLVDLMILAMAVIGTLTLTDLIDVNECPMKGFMNRSGEERFSKTWQFIITCAAVLLVIAGVSNNSKYRNISYKNSIYVITDKWNPDLIDFYTKKGVLKSVDGTVDMMDVFAAIKGILA